MLGVALNDKHARDLEVYQERLAEFGLDSTYLTGESLKSEIKSPRFIAGLNIPHGAI
jgi:hypothetical protein